MVSQLRHSISQNVSSSIQRRVQSASFRPRPRPQRNEHGREPAPPCGCLLRRSSVSATRIGRDSLGCSRGKTLWIYYECERLPDIGFIQNRSEEEKKWIDYPIFSLHRFHFTDTPSGDWKIDFFFEKNGGRGKILTWVAWDNETRLSDNKERLCSALS